MKKKKALCTILIAVIAIVGMGLIWYNSSVNMVDIDVEKMATIKVQNGNTGEILEITNQEDISYLIEQWNNTELSRQKLSFGYVGYSLRITILDESGKELSGMNNFYVNTNEVMRKDPFFYNLESGNLAHDYIQELFNGVESGNVLAAFEPREDNVSIGTTEPSQNYNWGITLSVANVTPTGLTLVCSQSGGSVTGELWTGTDYYISKNDNGTWNDVEYLPDITVFWDDVAWTVFKDSTTQWEIEYRWIHGELPKGEYKIRKDIYNLSDDGAHGKQSYYAMFSID